MDFSLTEEQSLLRSSVREFAEAEIRPHVREWDEAQHFPQELLPKLAELGLMGIQFAESYGGAAMSAVGLWWLYPVLWLLPLLTWYQLVSRIRNIAEHAVVPDNDDPLRNTRTTYANPVARLLLAPYWVNYHLEHHLLLSLPCWKLPAAHRVLVGKGLRDQMELRGGYMEVLRMAASAVGDGGGGSGRAKPAHI